MSLEIYFGTKAVGGNENLKDCRIIIEILSKYGNVLTKHLLLDKNELDIFEKQYEEKHPYDNTYLRDMRWLKSSHCFVGEYSNASTGLGYETCEVIHDKKPILALYKKGLQISRLITQNDYNLLDVRQYISEEVEDIDGIVKDFFEKHNLLR